MKDEEKIIRICSHIEKINGKLKEEDELYNQLISLNKDNIKKVENEINELKAKINNSIYLEKDEDLISIIFKEKEKEISFSVLCKNTDLFRVAFDKFKSKYNEIDEDEYDFFFNQKAIELSDTLKQIGLKNGDIINLVKK